jgi:hypothetical protein
VRIGSLVALLKLREGQDQLHAGIDLALQLTGQPQEVSVLVPFALAPQGSGKRQAQGRRGWFAAHGNGRNRALCLHGAYFLEGSEVRRWLKSLILLVEPDGIEPTTS